VADVVAIRVKADAKQAKGELKDLGGVFGKLDRAMKNPVTQFAAVAAGIAAIGVAAAATGIAVLKSAASVASLGDEIAKTARIVGVSAEQFQVLRFAAERSGVAMSSVTNGLKRLSRSMFDAQNGSKLTRDTFVGMGIAIEDADGNLRDSEDVFRDIADRIQTVGVNTQTTAELMTVLGRSGADLTNVLLGGSAGLDEFATELEDLGGILSGELLADSERFQDSMADLDFAFLGLKASIAEHVIPGLTDFVDFTAEVLIPELKDLASVVQSVGAGIVDDLRPALEMIGDMLTGRGFGSTKRALDTLKAIRGVGAPASKPRGTRRTGGRRSGGAPGGGGKKAEAVEEHRAVAIDMVAITQEGERLQTQAAIEGLADRLYWERDAQANLKAMRDKALEESKQRAAAEAAIFQATKTAQVDAVKDVLSSVETFANLAQTAVEDSYFGQTAAGRKAAKALFVAGKASALANAIVNTAQSITNALAVQPYPLGAALAVSAGAVGASQIGTIVGTTIQGLADAGLAPGALRDAGLSGHTAIAISPGEAVIDPVGTAEISRMLALQRRQMEMAAQGGANGGPIVVVAELDGRRVSRGLSGPMTADLEDGHDFRRNTRMEVG
jgi:hypothetical protein